MRRRLRMPNDPTPLSIIESLFYTMNLSDHRYLTIASKLLCSLTLALTLPRFAGAASGNPPGKITYQGFLTDASGVPLANTAPENKTVTFRIWNQSTGGTRQWSEQQNVAIDRGHFSVLLGEGSAVNGEAGSFTDDLRGVFATGEELYLELTVDGTTLAPRLAFQPAPYSILAYRARGMTDNSGSQKVWVDTDGVGIGFSNPSHPLHVRGRVQAGSFAGNGANVTSLNASHVSSGTLNSSRIPNLSASKITSGTLSSSRVPNLNASKITGGTLSSSRIPNLSASKITSGTLGSDRIPSLNTSKITSGRLSSSRLPSSVVYGDTSRGQIFRVGAHFNNVADVYNSSDKNRRLGFYRTSDAGVFRLFGRNYHSTADRYASYDGDSNWDFSSDRNLKKDIMDSEPVLERALQVRLRKFHWKEDEPGQSFKYGVIAQELQPLFPHMVTAVESFDGGDSYLSVGYSDFGFIAIGAVQELKQQMDGKVQALEDKNAALEKSLADLAARLQALETKGQ